MDSTIKSKISGGERLAREEGILLFDRRATDLHELGIAADAVKRKLHSGKVFYNINTHVNPTNRCIYRCPLCAFARNPDDADSYLLSENDILSLAEKAVASNCTELHMVSAVHPDLPYSWYLNLLKLVHSNFPSLHLKAWTAVEIARFAESTGKSIRGILSEMIAAGLGSLPGGGAEIFDPGVRNIISPKKIAAETWLEVHRTAHSLGLMTNATMLFGHIETPANRVDHILALRALQDESLSLKKGAFDAFVPLVFHPQGTEFPGKPQFRTSPDDVLRTVSASRLLLDNFRHVKAYWVSFGLELARIALGYGADDLDGTVSEEKIHHEAGADSPRALSVEELKRVIRETGGIPVERDSLYRELLNSNEP